MDPEKQSPRADLYRRITDSIVRDIEKGVSSFTMPWHQDGSVTKCPRNAISGRPYRGINVLCLWMAAKDAGYPLGLWATYRQWLGAGAQVRKGEKETPIIYWKRLDAAKESTDDLGDEKEQRPKPQFLAREFYVFNAAQVAGYQPPRLEGLNEKDRILTAEGFFMSLRIGIEFGGDEACYVPKDDLIRMPPFRVFRSHDRYYSTLFHECGHATGAEHRLGRDLTGRFGSEAYALEEMVAELASCFVCMSISIRSEPRASHAVYIASWLRILKSDSKAVFSAAGLAQRACDWMWAQQPEDTQYWERMPS
jgi:antirestriction protein ArdC